jgi:hypothetical protein
MPASVVLPDSRPARDRIPRRLTLKQCTLTASERQTHSAEKQNQKQGQQEREGHERNNLVCR